MIKELLNKLLDTIGFNGDKEKFIAEFEKTIYLCALNELILSLPNEKQLEVQNQLKENFENQEKYNQILNANFIPEQIDQSLKKAAQKIMEEYLKHINPHLTDEQRLAITQLAKTAKANF